jgi:cytoskeletal protein CcmA (bactofilin family)
MFNNQNSKKSNNEIAKNGAAGHSVNLIGKETIIKGEIHTDGDLRVDGKVEGKICSQSKVVVGESGIVNGSIYCNQADISGNLDGDVYTDDLLHLKGRGNIQGNIFVNKLIIETGSSFNGSCKMGENMVKNNLNQSFEEEAEEQEPVESKREAS